MCQVPLSVDIVTHIGLKLWIPGSQFLDIASHWVQECFHGLKRSNQLWHSLPQKLSTKQLALYMVYNLAKEDFVAHGNATSRYNNVAL